MGDSSITIIDDAFKKIKIAPWGEFHLIVVVERRDNNGSFALSTHVCFFPPPPSPRRTLLVEDGVGSTPVTQILSPSSSSTPQKNTPSTFKIPSHSSISEISAQEGVYLWQDRRDDEMRPRSDSRAPFGAMCCVWVEEEALSIGFSLLGGWWWWWYFFLVVVW